jgi:hypothetical protein
MITDVHFGYPLNPRIIKNGVVVYYDKEEKSITFVEKPFFKEGTEFSKPFVTEILFPKEKTPRNVKTYQLFDFLFTKYKYVDEKKTLFTQVLNY